MQPTKYNIKICQGATFKEVLRWESDEKVYKPITGISQNAPCELDVIGNNIPVGWRFLISNVKGMKEINSDTIYHTASEVTTDKITINKLNSIDYTPYTSGGIITYNKPVDLTGYTARMQLRSKLEDTVVLHEMTTENGGILINNTSKTISLLISASNTANFTFTNAVYSLELVSSGGEVTPFLYGSVSVYKEVTR